MNYHLYITIPVYILLHAGLFGLFRKAGEKGWKAFVPVLNILTWLDITGRKRWMVLLFLIPVLNFVMGIGLILDLVRSFGKHSFKDQMLSVLFPYLYFPYLGFNKTDKYEGKWLEIKASEPEKSTIREWLDAILFAGTAALVIRMFLIEAFMIPTTSMEGSLLAGDFLFVSKFHYGVRLPQAPLSFPFVHNTLPLTTGTKSYLEFARLPYSRLPGLKNVERNEIVVFNYPEDDRFPDVPELGPIHITSMKQNYIKRCVAVAGDTLEIRDQQIYINGKPGWTSENVQQSYYVTGIYLKRLEKEGFRTNSQDMNRNVEPSQARGSNTLEIHMSEKKMLELKQKYPKATFERVIYDYSAFNGKKNYQNFQIRVNQQQPKQAVFPKRPDMEQYLWTNDNFGPLWIPKAGVTSPINLQNLPLYRKIIEVYEDHDLEVAGQQIKIDGEVVTSYTFEMNYYWMMGDNRHQSLDSRYWGYVPEDHVIGRPWFVLLSIEGGFRWDRFFSGIGRWEP